jgi:hypothetical protein
MYIKKIDRQGLKLIESGHLFLNQSSALAERGKSHLVEDSTRIDTLSRIMKSEQDEKKHQLRLSKSQKVRFRKNSLWDRKQKNGPVIHIDPKDYQKLG